MDIMNSETMKKLIRLTVWFFRKKIGKQAEGYAIHNDMIHCANPGIKRLTEIINIAAENITDEEYQRNTVRELSELGLWIVYKDTGYRDVFFWVLDELLKNSDEVRELIKPYVQPPEKWYINLWSKSKKKSKKLRTQGKMDNYHMSEEETIFTPHLQNERLNKIK